MDILTETAALAEKRAQVEKRLSFLTDLPVTLPDVTPFLTVEQATHELAHACHILERALMSDIRFGKCTAKDSRYYVEDVWRKLYVPLVRNGLVIV